MHDSVLRFVQANLAANEVRDRHVIEVGSCNVNGSVRPIIEALSPRSYLGIDIAPGPGVDLVSSVDGFEYIGLPGGPLLQSFDLVVSTEMLEHAEDYLAALRSMCALTGETLVLTARGPGFPRHNPPDHWRFRPLDLYRIVEGFGLRVVTLQNDPQVPGVFLKAIRPGTTVEPERAPS